MLQQADPLRFEAGVCAHAVSAIHGQQKGLRASQPLLVCQCDGDLSAIRCFGNYYLAVITLWPCVLSLTACADTSATWERIL